MLIGVTDRCQKVLLLRIDVVLDYRAQVVQRTRIVWPQIQRLAIVMFCQTKIAIIPQKISIVVMHLCVVRQDSEAGSRHSNTSVHVLILFLISSYFSKLSRDSQSWFLVTVFRQKKQSTKNPATCRNRLIGFVIFSYSN
jgi:hypothetical protein